MGEKVDSGYLGTEPTPSFLPSLKICHCLVSFGCVFSLTIDLLGRETPCVMGIQLESGAREETGRFRDVKRCVATGDRTRVSGISLLRHNR